MTWAAATSADIDRLFVRSPVLLDIHDVGAPAVLADDAFGPGNRTNKFGCVHIMQVRGIQNYTPSGLSSAPVSAPASLPTRINSQVLFSYGPTLPADQAYEPNSIGGRADETLALNQSAADWNT